MSTIQFTVCPHGVDKRYSVCLMCGWDERWAEATRTEFRAPSSSSFSFDDEAERRRRSWCEHNVRPDLCFACSIKRTTRDELRGKVEVFLSAKKVTLWGDFDLSRQDRFDQAVEWLTDQIEGVLGAT